MKQAALTVLIYGLVLFPLHRAADTKDSPFKLSYKDFIKVERLFPNQPSWMALAESDSNLGIDTAPDDVGGNPALIKFAVFSRQDNEVFEVEVITREDELVQLELGGAKSVTVWCQQVNAKLCAVKCFIELAVPVPLAVDQLKLCKSGARSNTISKGRRIVQTITELIDV